MKTFLVVVTGMALLGCSNPFSKSCPDGKCITNPGSGVSYECGYAQKYGDPFPGASQQSCTCCDCSAGKSGCFVPLSFHLVGGVVLIQPRVPCRGT